MTTETERFLDDMTPEWDDSTAHLFDEGSTL